jgi:predicted nicotinamide N-methyase
MVATRQKPTDSRGTEKSGVILQNHPTFKGAMVLEAGAQVGVVVAGGAA